ncbi:hypothetical protein D1872_341850 [compost metagenome]
MITPFAALEPYNAAAVAPFRTEMFSISSGLRSCIMFPISLPALPLIVADELKSVLSIGVPSTTYSG